MSGASPDPAWGVVARAIAWLVGIGMLAIVVSRIHSSAAAALAVGAVIWFAASKK